MSDDKLNPPNQGEAASPKVTFTWIDPKPIEAGELLLPVKLKSSEAQAFADLHLVCGDLLFSLNCFNEAEKLGIPDDKNLHSKALIFSGAVGYARCFKSGVRSARLNPDDLESNCPHFNRGIHEYLIALRDKHIAHSVNDFEQCEAVAIVVGHPETSWRDGSAVGVAIKQTIGLTALLLRQAIEHIECLDSHIKTALESRRLKIYSEFKDSFEKGEKWEAASIYRVPNRDDISKRRT